MIKWWSNGTRIGKPISETEERFQEQFSIHQNSIQGKGYISNNSIGMPSTTSSENAN